MDSKPDVKETFIDNQQPPEQTLPCNTFEPDLKETFVDNQQPPEETLPSNTFVKNMIAIFFIHILSPVIWVAALLIRIIPKLKNISTFQYNEQFWTLQFNLSNFLLNTALWIGIWLKVVAIILTNQPFRLLTLIAQVVVGVLLQTSNSILGSEDSLFNNTELSKVPSIKDIFSATIKSNFPAGKDDIMEWFEKENWIFHYPLPHFPKRIFLIGFFSQFILSYGFDGVYFGIWLNCCDWWIETFFSVFIQIPLIYLATLTIVRHSYILYCRCCLLKKNLENSLETNFLHQDTHQRRLYSWCYLMRIYMNFGSQDLLRIDSLLQIIMFYLLLRYGLVWIENLWKESLNNLNTPKHMTDCSKEEKDEEECTNSVSHFYFFYGAMITIQLIHVVISFFRESSVKKKFKKCLKTINDEKEWAQTQSNLEEDLEEKAKANERAKSYKDIYEILNKCLKTSPLLFPSKMIAGLAAMSIFMEPLIEKGISGEFESEVSLVVIICIGLYALFLFLWELYHHARSLSTDH